MRQAAEACVVAVVVRIALPVLPLDRVLSLLASGRRGAAESLDVAGCLAAAATAARRVAHPTCLYESLIAFSMLARRGAPVVFHLGVSSGVPFEAHAWISVAGQIAGDAPRRWPELWRRAAAGLVRT